MKKIFVSILNYNNEKITIDCLETLSRCRKNGMDIHIIVADNNSREGFTIDKTKFPKLQLQITLIPRLLISTEAKIRPSRGAKYLQNVTSPDSAPRASRHCLKPTVFPANLDHAMPFIRWLSNGNTMNFEGAALLPIQLCATRDDVPSIWIAHQYSFLEQKV